MTTAGIRPPLARSSDRVIAGVCSAWPPSGLAGEERQGRHGAGNASRAGPDWSSTRGCGSWFPPRMSVRASPASRRPCPGGSRTAPRRHGGSSGGPTPRKNPRDESARRHGGCAGPVGAPSAAATPANVPGHAVRQGNPPRRRAAAGGRDHDRPAAGRRRAAGNTYSRRRRPGRRVHRLDAAGRNPAGRAGGQDQGGPGRRLGPARGRPGAGGRRGAGDGVRFRVLGADLAGAAGLRRGAGRRGPGPVAVGAEVLAGSGDRARRQDPGNRAGRDRRAPARFRAADARR